MEELESLLYQILTWDSLILEGSGLQLQKIGALNENSRANRPENQGREFGSG